ncbi:MAG: response regulator [bacterium]
MSYNYSVVIIDDHQILVSGLHLLIETQNDLHVVGEASNEASAIKIIKEKKPDVILLDISLSDISGLDLIPKLKDISPESKILILTMHDSQCYLQIGFDNGATGFLVKKAVDEDLIYAIKTVARGEVYIHPSMLNKFIRRHENKINYDSKEELLWSSLSSREQEVLIGIAHGYTYKEIAKKFFLSEKTVATYRYRGMEKLDIKTKSELTDMVLKLNLFFN